jgi:hypothetical protein
MQLLFDCLKSYLWGLFWGFGAARLLFTLFTLFTAEFWHKLTGAIW